LAKANEKMVFIVELLKGVFSFKGFADESFAGLNYQIENGFKY